MSDRAPRRSPRGRIGIPAVALLAFALVAVPACGNRHSGPPAGSREFALRGQVLGLRPDVREVRIRHEAIPGYMDAMTMSFAVRDARLLAGLGPGDLVEGTLVVTDTDAWLSRLRKTGHGELKEEPTQADAPAPAPVMLEPGQPLPDEQFTDQDGRPWRPSRLHGKAFALTFIYTRCPLPTYCPRMDRNFVAVQRAVAGRPALAGRVQLVTVSFDPAFDTPAVLKQHAASIGADLGSWTFVTAPAVTVDRFGARLGLTVMRNEQDASDVTHNLRTAVVDRNGALVAVLGGNTWTPEELVEQLARAANP